MTANGNNSQLIRELFGEFKRDVGEFKREVVSELKSIRADISSIKADVSGLKADVRKLQTDLSGFTMKEFNDFRTEMYIFRDNLIFSNQANKKLQEREFTEHICMRLNNTYSGTVRAEITREFTDFYRPNGNHITDIDGCIVLSSKSKKPNMRPGLKNNSLQENPAMILKELLIIESKSFLDKRKLDNKLIQFVHIYNFINGLKTMPLPAKASALYMNMITLPLLTSPPPTNITFVIAANDITTTMREYIQMINDGKMTRQIYEAMCVNLFIDDPLYSLIEDACKSNQSISNKMKKATTFRALQNVLANPIFKMHKTSIDAYFIDFDIIEPTYTALKERLGWFCNSYFYTPIRLYASTT